MRVYRIAWLLFKNNIRLYKFYILVLISTIAVYYNFLAVYYNPYAEVIQSYSDFAKVAGWMCSWILFWVMLFFMNHVNTFFYKQRAKEIATYMLMGIKKKQIGKLIAMESTIVGGVSLGIGTLIGIILSKLFFMILGSSQVLGVHLPFYLSSKAIIVLVIIMSFILGVLAIRNIMSVNGSKLIELLNAQKQGSKYTNQYAQSAHRNTGRHTRNKIGRYKSDNKDTHDSKQKQTADNSYYGGMEHEGEKEKNYDTVKKVFSGLIGIVCIGLGYYYANDFSSKLLQVILLVCIGTYLVFSGFFTIMICKIIKNKHLSYKSTRLISLSNILFRLEFNYRSYAATAILSAATLTALMTCFSLKQFERDNLKYEMPYSVSYINDDEDIHQKVLDKIANSKHQLLASGKVHFIKVMAERSNSKWQSEETVLIVPFSEMKANVELVDMPNTAKIIEEIEPKEEAVSMILRASVAISTSHEESYAIGEYAFPVTKVTRAPFLGKMPNLSTYDTLVVSDVVYEKLKQVEEAQEYCLNNISFSNQAESIELVTSLMRIIPDYKNQMTSYVAAYSNKYYIMGSFYFMGMILSLIFVLTVFSTIYFKCLSDATSDKKQYGILKRLGVSKQVIKKSIRAQNSMAVILPAMVGMVHSWVAIGVLENFMHLDFLESKILGLIIFSIVMLIFFAFINRKYLEMISEKEV